MGFCFLLATGTARHACNVLLDDVLFLGCLTLKKELVASHQNQNTMKCLIVILTVFGVYKVFVWCVFSHHLSYYQQSNLFAQGLTHLQVCVCILQVMSDIRNSNTPPTTITLPCHSLWALLRA